LHGIPGKAVWPFTLALVLLSGVALLLLSRRVVESVNPGFGLIVGTVLALGTMLLPYSTLYASHVPATALGFGAFAVLFHERLGERSTGRMVVAGALAGLAIVMDPPLGLVALVLAGYAAARRPLVTRLAAYAAGGLVGLAPLLAFNAWAFGSVTHQSYNDTVAIAGQSGHDVIGANENGLFGISVPSLNVAVRLLLVHRGLLVTTPLVAAGVAGLFMMGRTRWRTEAITIAVLVVAYLIYNAGYYQPFGGDSAGPRFLIPVLPFLALPLGIAFARYPIATASLSAVSIVSMVAAALTQPMLEGDDTNTWFARLVHGELADTLFTRLGVGSDALAMLPTAALLGTAVTVAALSVPRQPVTRRDLWVTAATLGTWACTASSTPALLASGLPKALSTLLAMGVLAIAVAAVVVVARRGPRAA
jgi:hypothetical protein